MNLGKILKNTFFMVIFCLVVTACATKKTVETTDTTSTETAKVEEKVEKVEEKVEKVEEKVEKVEEKVEKVEEKIVPVEPAEPIVQLGSLMQGDVYVGPDLVPEFAPGVKATVYFATNESILTTASRETLRKQAAWLRQNPGVTVVIEGHADERGTREYNLALGERRANAAKDYLMTYGVSSDRIQVLSYGKERPIDSGSNPLSWSKNRRSVTVKAN